MSVSELEEMRRKALEVRANARRVTELLSELRARIQQDDNRPQAFHPH